MKISRIPEYFLSAILSLLGDEAKACHITNPFFSLFFLSSNCFESKNFWQKVYRLPINK